MPSWKKVLISGSDAALNTLIVTNGITGSLFGTASWAVSASWAPTPTTTATASFVTASNVYGPYGSNSIISASYAVSSSRAVTSSFALTSSYAINQTISGSINNVDYIDFNTGSATPAYKSGRVFFDNVDGALSVYNAEADITLQVGQESWVRVFNEGTTITNGTAVRLVGSHGDVPLIVRAQSAQVSGSALGDNQIIGVATHTIETNSIGYVTTQGLVRGLNTNAFVDGDLLFVSSSAGVLTNVIPQAPFEVIQVGICVKAGPGGSGIIFVFPTQPIDFGDLASAERGTYQYGDIWSYQQTGSVGVWKHGRSLSGSYGITGSLNVTQGITGSLFGTASYTPTLQQVTTAGATTSNELQINRPNTQIVLGDESNNNAILINTFNGYKAIEIESDGIGINVFATNERAAIFGVDSLNIENIVEFKKNSVNQAYITHDGTIVSNKSLINTTVDNGVDKLQVSGSTNISGNTKITGSLNVTAGITGSLFGTSSWAVSASYISPTATNAFIQGGNSFGTTALLGTNDNQSLAIETSGSTRMFISSSGNVGIGTTAPITRLHVDKGSQTVGGTTPSGGLVITNLAGSNYALEFGTDTSLAPWIQSRNATSATYYNLLVNPSGGNVGIGKTNPTYKLDVSGSVNTIAPYQAGGTFLIGTLDTATNDYGPVLTFYGNYSGTTPVNFGMIRAAKSSVGGQRGYMSFHTGASGASLATESMRIDWNGNILVGTTTNSARLMVKGSGATSSTTALLVQNSNTSASLAVLDNGFVGIGTSLPSASLHVQGTVMISQSLFQYSNNAAILSGSTADIASFPTSSYMAGFFDFVASSGLNARAGTVFTVWNGTSLEYVETSTNDIGSTTNLILSASLSGANVLLQGTSLSGSWNVKTLTRMI